MAKYSGYMSPEYAMDGIFSVKSDVFSFGVLVLEIISGKKNRGVYAIPSHVNLVAHVSQNFTLWAYEHAHTQTCTYSSYRFWCMLAYSYTYTYTYIHTYIYI